MKYRIKHTNIFRYESEVEQSLNTTRLKRRNNEWQRVLIYICNIMPKKKRKESIHSPTLSRRTPFSGIHSQCDSASSHDDHNIASSVG